jgi:hypothetical protein
MMQNDTRESKMSHLADIPVLETERLRFRAPIASDFYRYTEFRMSDCA